ncbi:hypothetical protein CU633_15370, partial [Bacillus sp. V3-13]|uniref:hypothetical protein n=1 Tax=Bacillus sp. V3-13 TaxID=2053728 RepID=UPI000CC44EA2
FFSRSVKRNRAKNVKFDLTSTVKTVSELRKAFPHDLQGSSGVFVTKEEAIEKFERTGYKRHYIKDDELVKLGDENVIAVTTQWGKGNIYKFINRAREFGYKIDNE